MIKMIADFDDVLFNTRDFVVDFKKIFFENGVSEELFQKYYYDYPVMEKDGGIKKYDPWKHLERIKSEGIGIWGIQRGIDSILKNSQKYLFPDAFDFCQKMSFPGKTLFLVSYGQTDFQKRKISGSGLGKFFKEIIITDEMKSFSVLQLMKKYSGSADDQWFFLDDRVEQIDDVKGKTPFVKTFFVSRPEGRYSDRKTSRCDFVCQNLTEVLATMEIL